MSLPREDLLTRTTLPAEADPYFARATVEDDVAPCGTDDTRTDRVLVDTDPGHPDLDVHFIDVDVVNPRTTFVNPDDDLYRRILTGTGGFVYERRGRTSSGETVPMGNGVLHLCRESAADATGRYPVFISENSIINNTPANAVPLRRVPFEFRPAEIIAIVRELRRRDGTAFRLPGDHYLIDPANHTQLSLMPDRVEIETIIDLIGASNSPIPESRRGPIRAALQEFIQTEVDQADAIAEQRRIPPWLLTIFGVVGGAVATFPVMWWMVKRQEKMFREMREEGVKYDITKVYRDRTEEFRAAGIDAVNTRGQERYIREIRTALNRGGYPHVLISGPSGSGKSHSVETVARLIVNGEIQTRLPSGIRFWQVDLGKMVTEAGAWQNGVRTVLGRVLDAAGTEPTLVHFLEADRLANAGSEGREILNLLPELLTVTEQKTPRDRNIYVMADSTRYETIYAGAPDLARRMHFVEIIPHTPDIVRNVLDNGILQRLHDERIPIRERFERIHFSPEALDAIAALGEYRDGAPPSSHLSLLDAIAEEADTRRPTGEVTITEEHVFRAVARDTRTTTDAVRAEFARRMAHGGFEGNMVIQEALLEGFYRAYPEPRGGMLNPLDLPPEAAGEGISIFDGDPSERPRSPSGRDATPRVVSDTSDPAASEESAPSAAGPTTPEPVIITDLSALPETRLDRDVVRSQVVLTYSRYFMSQAGRDALMDFRPLPEGDAVINSDFVTYVDQITDRIMTEFDRLQSAEAGSRERVSLERMWESQRSERGFIVRHGVPEGLLTDVAGRSIADWARSSSVSEFTAEHPPLFEREARSRLENSDSFRRGMMEMLRDPVRIGR